MVRSDAICNAAFRRDAEAATEASRIPVAPVGARLNAGAADAVAALVPQYSALLFRVAHAVLRSRADAEDVVQETFVRVLRRTGDLADVRQMRVWLVRITWNLALDRRRRLRPDQMDQQFAEALATREAPADVRLAQSEEYLRVLREMDRLPQAERHALVLSAVEEMSAAEMAAVLGRSESAARALAFRARTRLKERLGGTR